MSEQMNKIIDMDLLRKECDSLDEYFKKRHIPNGEVILILVTKLNEITHSIIFKTALKIFEKKAEKDNENTI